MEFERYTRLLRRRAWLVVLLGILAAATAGAISYRQPRVWQSTTIALVNPTQQVLPTLQGGQDTDTLVQTYVRLLSVTPVKDALVRDGTLTPEQALALRVTAIREVGTTVVDIKVQSPEAGAALLGARGIVSAFNSSLEQLQQQVQGANQGTRLQALVPVQTPEVGPRFPVSPRPLRDAAIALVAGLVLGVVAVLLLEYLDNTITTDLDVQLKLRLPVLGMIRFDRTFGAKGKGNGGQVSLAPVDAPDDPLSESYRALRTNVLFNAVATKLRTLVVTSTIPGEGKTLTAANLAVVMAQAGTRVILVDADFRRPDVHRIFGLENRGLGELMLSDHLDEDLVQSVKVPNLRVVCAGPTPPNPSELVGSTRMANIADRLKELCDLVIYDTPPIAAVTDATVIAAHADGTILVIEQGRASVAQIRKAHDTLQAVGARILGAVINKQSTGQAADYYVQHYGPDRKRARGRKASR